MLIATVIATTFLVILTPPPKYFMLWPHLWSYHSLNDGKLWLESQQPSSILICTSEIDGINASLCTSLSPSIHICLCRTCLPTTGREWAGVGRSHVSDRQLVSVSTAVLILRVHTRSKMSYHWVCVCLWYGKRPISLFLVHMQEGHLSDFSCRSFLHTTASMLYSSMVLLNRHYSTLTSSRNIFSVLQLN